MKTTVVALIALIAPAAGCGRSEEAQEADRIVHAIDVMRDAPNDPFAVRADLLAALEAEHPKGKLAVAAREACVKAYRAMVGAQRLEARVRGGLKGAADGGIDIGLLGDLGNADTILKESMTAMPDCDQRLRELRRAFR